LIIDGNISHIKETIISDIIIVGAARMGLFLKILF
tara:strand:+ start:1090 stop:1194 length:105 start_codon:yes stop_codon:yes gene_type:complete